MSCAEKKFEKTLDHRLKIPDTGFEMNVETETKTFAQRFQIEHDRFVAARAADKRPAKLVDALGTVYGFGPWGELEAEVSDWEDSYPYDAAGMGYAVVPRDARHTDRGWWCPTTLSYITRH